MLSCNILNLFAKFKFKNIFWATSYSNWAFWQKNWVTLASHIKYLLFLIDGAIHRTHQFHQAQSSMFSLVIYLCGSFPLQEALVLFVFAHAWR